MPQIREPFVEQSEHQISKSLCPIHPIPPLISRSVVAHPAACTPMKSKAGKRTFYEHKPVTAHASTLYSSGYIRTKKLKHTHPTENASPLLTLDNGSDFLSLSLNFATDEYEPPPAVAPCVSGISVKVPPAKRYANSVCNRISPCLDGEQYLCRLTPFRISPC